MNACDSGQLGVGLTGVDGWAEAFLTGDGGQAGVFIGSVWRTTDELAPSSQQSSTNGYWPAIGWPSHAPSPRRGETLRRRHLFELHTLRQPTSTHHAQPAAGLSESGPHRHPISVQEVQR